MLTIPLDKLAFIIEKAREFDAEVPPVDLGRGAEAGTGPAPGVAGHTVELKVQIDPPGGAVQVEFALDEVAVAVRMDSDRAVAHGRVARHVEEIGAAQVLVALGFVGVDRRGIDRRGDG